MTNKLFAVLILAVCFIATASAQIDTNKTKEEARNKSNGGIVYKIPENVMPLEWKDFRGMLMLCKDGPCVIFISYPNDGESIPDLKKRMLNGLGQMFLHDEAKAKAAVWKTSAIAANAGDDSGEAEQKLLEDAANSIQITMFTRATRGSSVVYGFLGRKGSKKGDSSSFLEEKGKGTKSFEKFWKSFS